MTNEILNYFSFEKEGNFKVTSSYFNFMIEVFKLDSPHLLLTLEKQTKIIDEIIKNFTKGPYKEKFCTKVIGFRKIEQVEVYDVPFQEYQSLMQTGFAFTTVRSFYFLRLIVVDLC